MDEDSRARLAMKLGYASHIKEYLRELEHLVSRKVTAQELLALDEAASIRARIKQREPPAIVVHNGSVFSRSRRRGSMRSSICSGFPIRRSCISGAPIRTNADCCLPSLFTT